MKNIDIDQLAKEISEKSFEIFQNEVKTTSRNLQSSDETKEERMATMNIEFGLAVIRHNERFVVELLKKLFQNS